MSSPEQINVSYENEVPQHIKVRRERQLALQAMKASGVLVAPKDTMMGVENRAVGANSPVTGEHRVPLEQTTIDHPIVNEAPNKSLH